VESLDGSVHGDNHRTADILVSEMLEKCSNESIDGSSHRSLESEANVNDPIPDSDSQTQAELDAEVSKPEVRFADEGAEAAAVDQPAPPAFDEENFPSLGAPPVTSANPPTAMSWVKMTGAPPAQASLPWAQAKSINPKNYILQPSTSPSTAIPVAPPRNDAIPSVDSTSSRIISSRGGGDYISKAASTLMATEDDGVGWINPTNLPSCRSTGDGMLHSQAKAHFQNNSNPIPESEEAAVMDPLPLDESPMEGTVMSKTQQRKMKAREAKARHLSETAVAAVADPIDRLVGCMTTDYAMQNVMLQMGLQVVSLDGNIIKQVKQWVLRCAGCYQIHYDMARLFCSHCGLNMLQRISASIDSKTGQLRLHLKKNYTPSRRGQVYSLPAPGKQHRFEGELLLREDQLLSGIWKQKVVKINKDIRSAFGDDITNDVGLQINKGANIKVGLGKRNPNAVKGRERRGKRKQK
jgi:rRNA maturation endonuclease Nob1